MNGNFSLAQKLTTQKAQARSYAEYVSRRANNWSKLVNIVSEAQTFDFSENRRETIDQIATRLITTAGFSDAGWLPLNEGLCSLHDTIKNLLTKARAVDVGPIEEMPDIDTIIATTTSDISYSINTLNNELINTYHSIVGDLSILEGYAGGDSISEVISIARDKMSSIFADGFSDLSNSFEAKIQAVKSKMNISDFLNYTLSFCGINDIADGNINVPSESNAAHYTGAAPTSAYCWDELGQAICSSFQVAAAAVKNAFEWVGDKISKLFRKAAVKLHEVVFDPYDINIINEDDANADWYVDGYLIQRLTSTYVNKPAGWNQDLFDSYVAGVNGKTVKFDFVFGTFMIKYDYNSSSSTAQRADFDVTLQAKPKPIDFDACAKAILETAELWTQPVTGYKMYRLDPYVIYQYVSDYGPSLNLATIDMDEVTLYRCFLYGRFLLNYCVTLMRHEFLGSWLDKSAEPYYSLLAVYNCGREWIPVSSGTGFVGNNDFYDAATKNSVFKYQDADIDFTTGNVIAASAPSYNNTDFNFCQDIINLFLEAQVNEVNHPLDFGWLPYMSSGIQWDPGKFEIKTDEQNIARFNAFITATVILYVAVSVIVTAVVLTKKLETSAFLKLQGALWTCTDQASSGNLTSAAIANYKRANRKYKFVSSITSLLKRNGATKATEISASTFQNPLTSVSSIKSSLSDDFNGVDRSIQSVDETLGTIATKILEVKQLISGS